MMVSTAPPPLPLKAKALVFLDQLQTQTINHKDLAQIQLLEENKKSHKKKEHDFTFLGEISPGDWTCV